MQISLDLKLSVIFSRDLYAVDLDTYLDVLCDNRKVELKSRESVFGIDGGKKKLLVTLSVVEDEKNDDENREQKAKSWGTFTESCQALQ